MPLVRLASWVNLLTNYLNNTLTYWVIFASLRVSVRLLFFSLLSPNLFDFRGRRSGLVMIDYTEYREGAFKATQLI